MFSYKLADGKSVSFQTTVKAAPRAARRGSSPNSRGHQGLRIEAVLEPIVFRPLHVFVKALQVVGGFETFSAAASRHAAWLQIA